MKLERIEYAYPSRGTQNSPRRMILQQIQRSQREREKVLFTFHTTNKEKKDCFNHDYSDYDYDYDCSILLDGSIYECSSRLVSFLWRRWLFDHPNHEDFIVQIGSLTWWWAGVVCGTLRQEKWSAKRQCKPFLFFSLSLPLSPSLYCSSLNFLDLKFQIKLFSRDLQ